MSRDDRCEVGPVAELKSDGPEYDEREQAEFEKHQRAYEPAAEADAANVDERDGDDRRDGEKFCGPGREMDDVPAYVASPTASAAVRPGSITRKAIQPYMKASAGPNA